MRLLNRARQSEILFHHRFPTSTENVRNACHPFSTKDNYDFNYVMVHNGVIWNDDTVAKEQMGNGVSYISKQRDGRFNDSEVLLYDLADVFEGHKTSLSVEGSIAFVVVKLDKQGNRKQLLFGRNTGSPLKIMKYHNGFSICSEGAGVDVEPNKLFKYDYSTGMFSSTDLTIPKSSYYSSSRWNDYDYREYDADYDINEYGQRMSRITGYDDDYPTWRSKQTGVGYDEFGNKIDQNGWLVPDVSKSYVFTEKVLDRYKGVGDYSPSEADVDVSQAVKEVKNALLYDMNYATDEAVIFAEYLYTELETRYNEIDVIISSGEKHSANLLDEYIELDTQMELLTRAIKEMESTQLQLALKSGLKELTV